MKSMIANGTLAFLAIRSFMRSVSTRTKAKSNGRNGCNGYIIQDRLTGCKTSRLHVLAGGNMIMKSMYPGTEGVYSFGGITRTGSRNHERGVTTCRFHIPV